MKTILPDVGISIAEIRLSDFIIGNPILVRQHLYIETASQNWFDFPYEVFPGAPFTNMV